MGNLQGCRARPDALHRRTLPIEVSRGQGLVRAQGGRLKDEPGGLQQHANHVDTFPDETRFATATVCRTTDKPPLRRLGLTIVISLQRTVNHQATSTLLGKGRLRLRCTTTRPRAHLWRSDTMGGQGNGKKRKANPGVGVDFKRVKHKVGKKLPKAQNDTDVSFRARSIHLPGQLLGEDKGVATNAQNLTLKVS